MKKYWVAPVDKNTAAIHSRDGNRSGRPAGRVTGRVKILRPAGQAGWNTGQILLSCNLKTSKYQPKYTYIFIINETFYKKKKKSINKQHLLKTLVAWFQAVTNMLWPLRHAHPGAYLRGRHCAKPPLGPRHKAKSCKIYVKIAWLDYKKACMWKKLTQPGILASS